MPKSPEVGYQPTDEEIEKAEEMMTSTEDFMSRKREENAHYIERETGAPGHLVEKSLDDKQTEFTGEIKGHTLRFIHDEGKHPSWHEEITAWVDGIRVNPETAHAIYDKYSKLMGRTNARAERRLDEAAAAERASEHADLMIEKNADLKKAIDDLLQ